MNIMRDYAYGWVIATFFIVSMVLYLVFGWWEYETEQLQHGFDVDLGDYWVVMIRDAFENIQSEMLQLLCQVGLLAWLLFKGSPQSKDEHDRIERKLDEVRRMVKDLDERMGRH